MKPARYSYFLTSAFACAAVLAFVLAMAAPAAAGAAKDFWNSAAQGDGSQTKATPQPTAEPAAQSTPKADKGALGTFWDKAASGDKATGTATPPQSKTDSAQTMAATPAPQGPKEPPEPTQPISDWQRYKFLGIVDILTPPDAKKYADHKKDMLWIVGKYYQYKLFFGVEMVRDPEAKAKSMNNVRQTKAVINGVDGKDWITSIQYDGTMKQGGAEVPARLVVTTDPLPNGMYLAFFAAGKDFEARKNDVAVFFESIRVARPQGEAMWQRHQWRGLNFKTLWGWQQYKGSQWANGYKGYERGTGREMSICISWMKTPYEQELPTAEKMNKLTRLGDKTINGIPVKVYELTSEPGQPFAATLIASVQAPLAAGGYVYISGSVTGGDGWGGARQEVEEMMGSVTAEPGILDLSKVASAAEPTPEMQSTMAAPTQLPETKATPETAAPETHSNQPIAASPEPTATATLPVPTQLPEGNPTPDTAPPETLGNLPMTATPEPTAPASPPVPTQLPEVNATPDTAAPETLGNLPMTATPEPSAAPTEPAPAATSAAATAAGVEASCKLKSLRSFYDMAGRGEEVRGDGSPEALMELKIKAPGRTIESLAIKNTDGQDSEWDTIPGNGKWVVVITERGKALNEPHGSVSIKLGDGQRKFGLLVQDNNAIASGKTSFVVKITLDGGEVIDVPVQR